MDQNLLNTIVIWAGIGFVFLALTLAAFLDVARKDFGATRKKAMWAIISLIPFVGFLFYLMFGMRKGKKTCA